VVSVRAYSADGLTKGRRAVLFSWNSRRAPVASRCRTRGDKTHQRAGMVPDVLASYIKPSTCYYESVIRVLELEGRKMR
jgi:hypothetical protein